MDRFRITRKIEIDAAHRVPDHGSKCQHVHGHRYVIEATCEGELAPVGEERGMVMDFGFLKEVMVAHIHDRCDHAMILWQQDPRFDKLYEICGKVHVVPDTPTAENLAREWFRGVALGVEHRTGGRAQLTQIRVYETPNCWADYPITSLTTIRG